MKHPIATIQMENGAKIVIELLPEAAPNTVNSFISLAGKGCFDGHAIQRIVPGYVADMSYTAFGRDECKYLIANESRNHGFPNNVKVEPGVVAMGGYGGDIAGGEFFFPFVYAENIDGNYPAFGKVLEGWDEVARWEKLELREVPYPGMPEVKCSEPVEPLVIASVWVETFGEDFPEPVKLEGKEQPANWK